MRPRPVQTKKRENHEATSAVKLRVLSPKSEAESAVEDAKVFTSSKSLRCPVGERSEVHFIGLGVLVSVWFVWNGVGLVQLVLFRVGLSWQE